MKLLALLVIIIIIGIGTYFYLKQPSNMFSKPSQNQSNQPIRYVAIGDSYTIGQGVATVDRWPNRLVEQLRQENINITLVSNLAVSGYTSQDAILKELPDLKEIKPDFVTILIGANDSFQKVSPGTFRTNFKELLDETQTTITNPQNIVVITIPNFTKSPAGMLYGAGQGEEQLIKDLNKIIKEEAENRALPVVDLYPPSEKLTDPKYYTEDGLHPSAQGYQEWLKTIYPVIKSHLIKQ